ncbi:MAG: hypothetical protein ACREX9_18205 [Gammaproteobacteria bacterium]
MPGDDQNLGIEKSLKVAKNFYTKLDIGLLNVLACRLVVDDPTELRSVSPDRIVDRLRDGCKLPPLLVIR